MKLESDSTLKLDAALLKARTKFATVEKKRTAKVMTKSGREYTYRYADLSDINAAVMPALIENEINLSSQFVPEGDRFWLTTKLIHSSGEFRVSVIELPRDVLPQELGSESTYYRRYNLCALLEIIAEEDDDAQVAQQRPQARPPLSQAKPAAPSQGVTPQPRPATQPGPTQAPQPHATNSQQVTQPVTQGSVPYKDPATSKVREVELQILRQAAKQFGWLEREVTEYVQKSFHIMTPRELLISQFETTMATMRTMKFADLKPQLDSPDFDAFHAAGDKAL